MQFLVDVVGLSSTLTRLDMETRSYQPAVDAPWQSLLSNDVTIDRYVDRLRLAYGFEGPLEAALAYTPHLRSVIHIRLRSGLLAQDLLELGGTPAQLAHAPQYMIAPFPGLAQALGWMYAAQRTSRLHDEVRAYLVARLRVDAAVGYLSSQQTSIGSPWLELATALDRVVRSPRIEEQIVTAAHDAFRAWIGWFAPVGRARASATW